MGESTVGSMRQLSTPVDDITSIDQKREAAEEIHNQAVLGLRTLEVELRESENARRIAEELRRIAEEARERAEQLRAEADVDLDWFRRMESVLDEQGQTIQRLLEEARKDRLGY